MRRTAAERRRGEALTSLLHILSRWMQVRLPQLPSPEPLSALVSVYSLPVYRQGIAQAYPDREAWGCEQQGSKLTVKNFPLTPVLNLFNLTEGVSLQRQGTCAWVTPSRQTPIGQPRLRRFDLIPCNGD